MNLRITLITLIFVVLAIYVRFVKQRSLAGAVGEVYKRNRAVPKHYKAMDVILEEFKNNKIKNENSIIPWENLIELGDVYARGLYPHLLPDEDIALLCYEAAGKCPDSVVRGIAQANISQMLENPVGEEDRNGEKMNVAYGQSIVEVAQEYQEKLSRVAKVPNVPKVRESTKDIKDTVHSDLELRNSLMRKQTNSKVFKPRVRVLRVRRDHRLQGRVGGGNQNTHDHGVTSATKANIQCLAEDFALSGDKFRSADEVLDEAVTLCKDVLKDPAMVGVTKDDVVNAHHVLVSLSPSEYSQTGVSQIQILDMVLRKIDSIGDTAIKDGVKETFCKRIATGFERGSIVCGTGKVARIVSVFEGVLENAQKSVSINLVEKEIAQLAAKIRKEFLDGVGPIGRKAYESDNSVPEYKATMSNRLRSEVHKEYIEKLNMKETVINPLLDVFVEAY